MHDSAGAIGLPWAFREHSIFQSMPNILRLCTIVSSTLWPFFMQICYDVIKSYIPLYLVFILIQLISSKSFGWVMNYKELVGNITDAQ